MSLLFTVLPILLGLRDWVGDAPYTKAWQFMYDFIYCLFAVSLSEELVFRGYIFYTLLNTGYPGGLRSSSHPYYSASFIFWTAAPSGDRNGAAWRFVLPLPGKAEKLYNTFAHRVARPL
jgi:hypothetical protein